MKLEYISKYRNALMALAMLWIGCYHTSFWLPLKPLNFFLKSISYGGVDIFIFLSAFGLYYSFKKDSNILSFYKKRLIRIFPAYIPLIVIYMFINHYGIKDLLLYILTLNFWFNNDLLLWYVSGITLLYLISPFYLRLFNKNQKLVTIISLLISIPIILLSINHQQIIFFTRIPLFILGFYFAYLNDQNKEINLLKTIILIIMMLVGFMLLYLAFHYDVSIMWKYGLYWLPFILIIPGFVLLLGLLLDKTSKISKALSKLGTISYEFYLFNELLVIL